MKDSFFMSKTKRGEYLMKNIINNIISVVQLLSERIRGIATEPQAEGYIPKEEIYINGKEV